MKALPYEVRTGRRAPYRRRRTQRSLTDGPVRVQISYVRAWRDVKAGASFAITVASLALSAEKVALRSESRSATGRPV